MLNVSYFLLVKCKWIDVVFINHRWLQTCLALEDLLNWCEESISPYQFDIKCVFHLLKVLRRVFNRDLSASFVSKVEVIHCFEKNATNTKSLIMRKHNALWDSQFVSVPIDELLHKTPYLEDWDRSFTSVLAFTFEMLRALCLPRFVGLFYSYAVKYPTS